MAVGKAFWCLAHGAEHPSGAPIACMATVLRLAHVGSMCTVADCSLSAYMLDISNMNGE